MGRRRSSVSPAGVMNRDAAAGYVLREGKFVVQELYWQCLGHSGAAGVRARAGVKSWARLAWAAGRLTSRAVRAAGGAVSWLSIFRRFVSFYLFICFYSDIL